MCAGYAASVLKVVRFIVLVVAGILLVELAGDAHAQALASRAALLAAGCAAFVAACPRRLGLGLLLAATFALTGSEVAPLEGVDLFSGTFWALGTLGFFLAIAPRGLRSPNPRPGWALVGASVPSWALSGAHEAFMYAALAFVFAGLVRGALLPILSGSRAKIGPRPDPIAAPLVEVAPQVYGFRRGIRVLQVLALLPALVAVTGLALGGFVSTETRLIMILVGGILSFSFCLSLWLNSRMGFRVDADGIHARVVFGETSIAWTEVAALGRQRLSTRGGAGYDYRCVRSVDREVTFPDVMTGSHELAAKVEAATGLRFD